MTKIASFWLCLFGNLSLRFIDAERTKKSEGREVRKRKEDEEEKKDRGCSFILELATKMTDRISD